MITWETEQEQIIDAPIGNFAVLACAGSGKTAVIVERISRLIEAKTLSPERVAVITFTVLAANELSHRFDERLKKAEIVGRPFTGTIHSFCLHFLKEYDPEYANKVKVLTEGKQFAIFYRKYNDWELAAIAPQVQSKTDIIELVIKTLDIITLDQLDPAILQTANPALAVTAERYYQWCREEGYLDFSQMLAEFRRKLNEPEFYKFLVERLDYLVIDEYQDTDKLQESLFIELSKALPVMVVGDDDQCIYQFRGTTVENIIHFTGRFKDGKTFPLSKNFRCGSKIVDLAGGVAGAIGKRAAKELKAHRTGGSISVRQFDTVVEEADFIAEVIQNQYQKGLIADYNEAAILLRSVSSHSEPYLAALRARRIPYIVRGDRGLFSASEVQEAMCLLEVISHPESNKAVLKELLAGLGVDPVAADSLADDVSFDDFNQSHWKQLGVEGDNSDRLKAVLLLRGRYREQKFSNFLDIYLRLLTAAKLFISASHDIERRNLARLSEIIAEYDEVAGGKNLRYMVNYLRAYGSKKFDAASPEPAEAGAVSVLTVHQAKGLEFELVLCPMLVEKRFPLESRDVDIAIDLSYIDASRYSTQLEDERRLFYVAVTRAKDSLYLTAAKDVGLKRYKLPSLFFQEASGFAHVSNGVARSSKQRRSSRAVFSSYSKVEYYLACPYRYKLLYDIGLATPMNPFFEFGKLIHLVLRLAHESHVEGSPLSVDELLKVYDENFPVIYNVPKLTLQKMRRRGEAALRHYLENNGKLLEQTAFTELPFDLPLKIDADGIEQAVHIIGQIDLVLKGAGGYEITDFKTGKPHDYIRTDLQLQIYCWALREQLGLNVSKASVFYVEAQEKVEYEVTPEWLNEGMKTLQSAVTGMVKKDFKATPGAVCSRCEVKELCEFRI